MESSHSLLLIYKKFKMELLYNQAIPLLGVYPEKSKTLI